MRVNVCVGVYGVIHVSVWCVFSDFSQFSPQMLVLTFLRRTLRFSSTVYQSSAEAFSDFN